MNLYQRLKFNRLSTSFWGYFLVILAIIAPWFLKLGYLFFTDMVWGPNIKLDWTNSWFLFNLLVKGLSYIFPFAFLEKIFISGILLLVLLGGRILVKAVLGYYRESDEAKIADAPSTSSHGLILVLSLFALFNPFVYDRALYGQFGILAAYGFFLFGLAYLFKAGRTLNFKNLYPAAIFTALTLMFSVHFIFFLIPFYLLFLIGLYLKRKEIKAGNLGKKLILSALASIFIVIILNVNWLSALVSGVSPTTNFIAQGISPQDLSAFATSGKTPGETLSNVLLMSGFWGKDQFRYLDLTAFNGWQRSFIFLLPLIFYGVFLSFKKRRRSDKILSAGLLIIFALAVGLAVGIKSAPTSSVTLFLYNHLPYYKGLREPQKWVAVIIPIYLFYLSLGAARLKSTKFISKNRTLSAIILTAIIIMGAPSLVWGFNRQVRPTPYPSDWAEVNNLLVNRSTQSYGCSDRILFLPWHMYLSFNWVGKVIANPAPAYFTCPVLSGTDMEWGGIYDNSLSTDGEAIEKWFNDKGVSGEPEISGSPIRYIIIAKELDFTSYLWINKLSYIRPLLETETLLVYEIKS